MSKNSQLTVSEAAQRVGVSRQTIFKAIKQGKLSATLAHEGVKQVDISELLRVYGRLLSPDEVAKNQVYKERLSTPEVATAQLQLELERAKLQIERRDFELEQLRSRLDEMRERERTATEERLRLFGIIERQSLLLSAPKPARAATTKAVPKAAAKAAPPKKVEPTATTTKRPSVAEKPAVKKSPAKASGAKVTASSGSKTTRKR